jgi:hypothetical protein
MNSMLEMTWIQRVARLHLGASAQAQDRELREQLRSGQARGCVGGLDVGAGAPGARQARLVLGEGLRPSSLSEIFTSSTQPHQG